MDSQEWQTYIKRLETGIRELEELKLIPDEAARLAEVYNEVCDILFGTDFYQQIWDEPVLLQIEQLFAENPPQTKVFGERVEFIKDRAKAVRIINDLFFSILDSSASEEAVVAKFESISAVDTCILLRLQAEDRLNNIR